MHFAYLNVVRRWQAVAADERRAGLLAGSLKQIARDDVVFAAAGSELGQDLTRPATRAARTAEGWIVSGRKAFCTMSPAADVLYTAVTFTDDRGGERYGYAMVPRETPGVIVHDDWDAMGMRASGSHSITFDDVALPASALRGGFPVGEVASYIDRNLNAGLLHAAASLGIAESANAIAIGKLTAQANGNGNSGGRKATLAADSTIDLAACRAVFDRAASLIDQHHASHPTSVGTDEALTALFAEVPQGVHCQATSHRRSRARPRWRRLPQRLSSPAPTATSAPAVLCIHLATTVRTSSWESSHSATSHRCIDHTPSHSWRPR
jgi:alkylation response protein AidB-like acyl-CoA dehydrogenase